MCGAGAWKRQAPDSRKATGGRVSGFFNSAFPCWLFPGIFPTADKSRGTRMFTVETGEIHPKTAAHLQNPVNFAWNRVKSWRFTVKSCKIERKHSEIKRISDVFIRHGSVFTVHCLIFGVKQKFLRNFAKTLDNIYMIDCTKCCVTCTTSYIFYL